MAGDAQVPEVRKGVQKSVWEVIEPKTGQRARIQDQEQLDKLPGGQMVVQGQQVIIGGLLLVDKGLILHWIQGVHWA